MFSTKAKISLVVFTLIVITFVFVGCSKPTRTASNMVNIGDMGRRADKYKTRPTTSSYIPNARIIRMGEEIATRDFYFTRVEPAFPEVSFD